MGIISGCRPYEAFTGLIIEPALEEERAEGMGKPLSDESPPLIVEKEGYFYSFDNTLIHYIETGEGFPVILANGLGGPYLAWKHLMENLKGRFRVISWDYRGTYGSAIPASGRRGLGIISHTLDLLELMRRAGVKRAVLIGWSMGVQVALEFYRSYPGMVSGMVLLNGVAGRPYRTAFRNPLIRRLITPSASILKAISPIVGPSIKVAVRMQGFFSLVKRAGLLNENADEEIFHQVVERFSGLDFKRYFRIFIEMGRHDAWDVLKDVQVPLLVISGERDLFTPPREAERMSSQVRGAWLHIVKGGTHYAPIEFPLEINSVLDRFLDNLALP